MKTRYNMFWDAYDQLGPLMDINEKIQGACRIVETCWEESESKPWPECEDDWHRGGERPYKCPSCPRCDRSMEKNTSTYIQEETGEDAGRERASADSKKKCQHEWVTDENDRHYCHKCCVFQERSV